MAERIDYLYDLGITCLWLMPFYPTARKDDGYDITDFFGVDPRLGTHGDFVELIRTARSSGIRVIVDFVMNHTSDAHPWFKSARRSKDDPYRDYYVWARPPKSSRKDVVFPDEEDSLGSSTRGPTSGTCTTSTSTNPTSTSPIRKCRTRFHQSGVLARTRRLGLPGRRRAVPVRQGRRAGRSRRVRPHRLPRRRPDLRHASRATRSCSARSTCRLQGPERRSSADPTATGSTCNSTSSGCRTSTSPRARRCAPAGQGPAASTATRPDEPMGELRAQPRRAHPRQAQ